MWWIAGAKGLLGATLFAKCGEKAIGTGREVDISNRGAVCEFVEKNPQITHIVNCAAFSQVDLAEKKKEEAFQTNVLGPENLGIAARSIGAKLIHLSTDYVFSGDTRRPLTEEDPVAPCNYYGWTKWEAEKRVSDFCVIRTSWIFGEGGKNFVSYLLQMLLSQKEIRLTDDQWGRFTYAPDLAEAILQMADRTGLYQYANAGVATKYAFGLKMKEEALRLGFPVVAESILPVPGCAFPAACKRPIYSAFNTQKIEQFLPIRHWEEALRDFLCARQLAYL